MAIGNDKERLKPSCSPPPPPPPPPQDPFQMVTLFFFYRKSSNYGDDKFPLTRFFSKKAYSLRPRRVKFMKSSTSGSVKFVCISLDRPTRPFRLLQTDRTSEDRFRDKPRSSRARNYTNKSKICIIMYI